MGEHEGSRQHVKRIGRETASNIGWNTIGIDRGFD